LLFVIFLIFISENIRATSDDLWFYNEVKNKGWINALISFEFNPRWFSYGIFNTIVYFSPDFERFHHYLYIYYLLTFTLLYWASFRFFKNYIFIVTEIYLKTIHILLIASIFIISLYFITTNAIEVWFWPIASVVYLYPIILFLFGLAELASQKNNKTTLITMFVCFFLIGGTAENFAFAAFLFFTLVASFSFYKNPKYFRKSVLSMIAVSLLPAINILGSGIKRRMDFETTMMGRIADNIFLDSIAVYFNVNRIGFFVLILVLMFFLGALLAKQGYIFKRGLNKIVILKTLAIIVIAIGTFLPLYIVFGNLGPSRAWIPLSFGICLSMFVVSFYAGNTTRINFLKKISNLMASIISILCSLVIIHFFISQKKTTDEYSKAYDSRLEKIKTGVYPIVNQKYIFIPDKLPDSGIISSQELSKKDDIVINLTSHYLGKVLGKDAAIFIENCDSDNNN